MVVTLTQLPMKSIVMDIVVADILAKFGILLSRMNLAGTLQMDMSYATIPIFGGEHRRLYKEVKFVYMDSDQNHLVYAIKEEMGSCILYVDNEVEICIKRVDEFVCQQVNNDKENDVWKIYFDGASSKEGSGATILLISPSKKFISLSYKIEFYSYK